MKKNEILDSMSYVDSDLICEAEENSPVKKRKSAVKWVSLAACLCICVAVAFAIGGKGNILTARDNVKSEKAVDKENIDMYDYSEGNEVEPDGGINVEADAYVSTEQVYEEKAAVPAGKVKTTTTAGENTTEKSAAYKTGIDGGKSGGDTDVDGAAGNYFFIPAVPKSTVKATGEKLTDAEANKYLEENKTSLVSSLAESGVKADNIRISDKGYSHLVWDGSEMEYIEYRQNFRDYPVYNGNELVAIVTLWKENGQIYSSPAFGAPWFRDYNAFLQSHKGQKLIYAYAGMAEIIITPDGKAYSPQGYDVSRYIEGIDNPYNYFYSEGATYTP